MPGDGACLREPFGRSGDGLWIVALHRIDTRRCIAAGKPLHEREAPGAVLANAVVAGGMEHEGQRIGAAAQRRLDGRQEPGVQIGRRLERVIGQWPKVQQFAPPQLYRRSRVRVMPIFSFFSVSASLTILTVTASTRVS